ncbi:hypothetical protein TBLA_0E01420 [Henningerozyma blattae CBS 6284]|uniref:Proteasome component ECM29 n=1 Tax=Henningerozyma blattae (strain ATCC 34711 / CBS 6284 / DSM 70876 / NBRC 10599 / NRRL Y-10934 / UCD 77-7) TaxID=1071380 RepID=I2H499_HENB6|nr:hypothetical protein TBLA_0E01420 [Tetrapisispora blattae CBS 6284]CCH61201.1 hypothetical protein TBLA_0E01420 [Tetrapisispora blattae CBS 6284]
MAQLSELKEKELVEKVELRLALSETAEKFEKSLDTFLCPLLLKLASPYGSVRQAVFQTLKHVLGRLNALPDIQLPVEKLILQGQNPILAENADDSNVRLYSLLLASKGTDRLSQTKKRAFVPTVMSGISSLPSPANSRMFHILCKLLLSWVIPAKGTKEEDDIRDFLHLEDENDLHFLLEKFTQFFMLVPAKPDPTTGVIPRGYSCPGLCSKDVEFFTFAAGVSFTRDQIIRFKSSIFKFVTNGFVQDDEILIKFLCVASTDKSDISDSALHMLTTLQIPYEQEDFINYLSSLFIGGTVQGRPPVSHGLQEKILTILNRSIYATTDPLVISKICSIGLHSDFYKLRSLCLTFITFVAQHHYENLAPQNNENGSTEGFTTNIASLIRENLHTEGWPKLEIGASTPVFKTSILQRRAQYETLGVILQKDFTLVEDLSFIKFLFDSLLGDLPDFRTTIQETMASLAVHLNKLSINSKADLKILLKKYLQDDYDLEILSEEDQKSAIMSCRYVCIKYANAAFDFDDTEARMFNIWGTSRTNRFDIIEEATKGLHPYWFRANRVLINPDYNTTSQLLSTEIVETKFPNFKDYIILLLSEINLSKKTPSLNITSTLNTAVRFAKQILISEATFHKKTVISQDEDWSIRIDKALDIDDIVVTCVQKFIDDCQQSWFVSFMQCLGNEFLVHDEGEKTAIFKYRDSIFGTTLLLLLRFCSKDSILSLESLIPRLYDYLKDINVTSATDLEVAANILGIVASDNPTNTLVRECISKLDNTIPYSDKTTKVNIYAGSYILPRLYLKKDEALTTPNTVKCLFKYLLTMLSDSKHKIEAIKLLSQVTKFGLLSKISEKDQSAIINSIFEEIQSRLLSDENTVELLGYLSMYASNFEQYVKLFNKLVDCHTTKHIELLFAAGEALSIFASSYDSVFIQKQIDVNCDYEFLKTILKRDHLNYVLQHTLNLCNSPKPTIRKAACIWLLSLIQNLSKKKEIIDNCKEIHFRFMKFLSDRDELVQEVASRGLGLVYELGTKDLQEDMVKGLLKSFTNSSEGMKMSSGSVSEDTELFDQGLLNTGEGSVRTYKDILNLASEVGDPALVYQFMSLSKSAALWSSRKGVAFGLGAIMSKNAIQLRLLNDENTALKLIPKLYRYKFDPYSSVARSMNDIWDTLISNSSEIIAKYFDAILKELLSGMGNKEWRVREASTSALLQLVQTQPQEQFSGEMLDLWTMAFRTMDDIKESVREVGTKLTTYLSKILAKSIDVSKGVSLANSKTILDNILPFFLGTKGLESDAEPVRKFALNMLMDLVKNSAEALIPFAPKLVYDFTLLFSSIEPQVINYLALNAANYNIDASTIDAKRRSGVSGSPLLESIEKLIKLSTEKQIEDHVNNSIKAARKSVGLPSKVAASTVIALLVNKYFLDLKPYSGKLLKVCVINFDDRNTTIKLSFAKTFGHIYKVVSLDKGVKYGKQLTDRYFSKSSNDDKKIVATAINSVLKYAQGQFENIASIFMPILFVGSSDSDKEVCELFNTVWTEASSSGSGTVKLYLDEILELLSKNIGSQDFNHRKTCAKAVTKLCQSMDTNASTSDKQIMKIFQLTSDALKGRSWDGKELLLESLSSLIIKFSSFLDNDNNSALVETLRNVIFAELARNNKAYVQSIILPVSKALDIFKNDTELVSKLLETITKSFTEEINDIQNKPKDDGQSDKQTTKRIKPNEDINKKSSKENIRREEFINQELEALSSLKDIPNTIIKFIVTETLNMFNQDNHNAVLYSWRSHISGCIIGINLINEENNCQTHILNNMDNVSLIMELWSTLFKISTTKESIENVKLKLIQFGGKLNQALKKFNHITESQKVSSDLTDFHQLLQAQNSLSGRLEAALRDVSAT